MMFRVYRDALGPELNQAAYDEAMSLRDVFEPSRTSPSRDGPGRVDPNTRLSNVVYDRHLTRFAVVLRRLLDAHRAESLSALGIPPFPVAGMEIQMTAHGDGEFFRRHSDSGSQATADRALTFVYYFHAEPKRYHGGEIVFFSPDGHKHELEPENDMLVLFDPKTPHEVCPVVCPSRRFEDGRFTLNGWLRRRRPAPEDTFFDRRIFTAVGSWPGMPAATSPGPASARLRAPHGPTQQPSTGSGTGRPGLPEALLSVYSDLQRMRRRPRTVDEPTDLTADEFFDRFFCANRPVVLRGAFASSEAVARWTPGYLAKLYPDVLIDITSKRASVTDYEIQFRETVRTVPFSEFAERLATEDGNDYYLVARNNFFDNPKLRHLRDQLRPPAGIIDGTNRAPGSAKLWIGPSGTVTPLHFDEHSILFAQVYGRKHFKLVPPFDYPLVYPRDRYYSSVDPENVDLTRHPLFERASLMDVVLEPGDSLLIPAGWWHWVRSLSTSISATFSAFSIPGGNVRLGRPLSRT
jgi:hypothetical protein